MKLFVIAAVLALATPAFADKKSDAAAAFKEGQDAYLKDDYVHAAFKFKQAYDLDPDPVYLFNGAQAYRLAKKCVEATELYNKYLEVAPSAPNVQAVKDYLKEIEECTKAQTPPKPVEPIKKEPDPIVTPPQTDEPSSGSSTKRRLSYVAGGVGLVSIVAGFYFMKRVGDTEDDANKLCTDPCDSWTKIQDDEKKRLDKLGHRRERFMVAGWAVGGAAIAAGVFLFLTSGNDTKESNVVVSPTTNGANVLVRF